jgi:hypothetical protein
MCLNRVSNRISRASDTRFEFKGPLQNLKATSRVAYSLFY